MTRRQGANVCHSEKRRHPWHRSYATLRRYQSPEPVHTQERRGHQVSFPLPRCQTTVVGFKRGLGGRARSTDDEALCSVVADVPARVRLLHVVSVCCTRWDGAVLWSDDGEPISTGIVSGYGTWRAIAQCRRFSSHALCGAAEFFIAKTTPTATTAQNSQRRTPYHRPLPHDWIARYLHGSGDLSGFRSDRLHAQNQQIRCENR